MASAPEKALNELSLNDSLRVHLECPICFECCKTPIFMCVNGHHVCHKCVLSLSQCPTCRVEGQPKVRCSVLEKIADTLKMPCENKREGCDVVLNAKEMASHWDTCKIQYTYRCNICTPCKLGEDPCSWKGDRKALVAHVKTQHPGWYSEEEIIQIDMDITYNVISWITRLISAHNELFWVEFWLSIDTAYIFSRYIGRVENMTHYMGKFVCRTADRSVENITIAQHMHVNEVFLFNNSTYGLKLAKVTIDQFKSGNTFAFTAQILKK